MTEIESLNYTMYLSRHEKEVFTGCSELEREEFFMLFKAVRPPKKEAALDLDTVERRGVIPQAQRKITLS